METHPIEYIDIPRATFCTPNVASLRADRGAGARAGHRRRRRQGPVRRGRRRHRLRRPRRRHQDHRRQEVRRAGRRPHRRRQGDRADPGARQRQGARGRLPRGRADRPRPPDAVRGRHGGRARRRRLAHPRLSRATSPLLLRPRLARGVPRGRARAARARPRCPSGSRCGCGGVAPRSAARRRSPIYREDVERRARRVRAAGAALARPVPVRHASWAMLAATYAKQIGRGVAFSLAALPPGLRGRARPRPSATTS